MKLFTRRELQIGGAVLVVLAVLVPRLMDRIEATRAAKVWTDTRDWVSAQPPHREIKIAANEAAVLEDVRKVIAAQAAYRAANHGFYEGRLDCLVSPEQCIPSYPRNAPAFLDRRLATLRADSGYRRSFTTGPGPASLTAAASGTSVTTYRYDAWPGMVGHDGLRAFAADATGRICFTPGGTPVSQGSEGELEPSCSTLEPFEPKGPSDGPTAPPTP